MARAFSPAPLPDFTHHLIASAVTAAFDRLNIAPVCRPRLADLDPREVEILLAALRRLIGQRQEEEAKARTRARRAA